MNPVRRIGIFGGSFNPIHIGHLALANYLCEYESVDEVWFLVSPHNPLKERGDLWADDLRLRLVECAVAGYDKFRASDFEFHLPRPSYMLHTLRALREQHPDCEFVLLIGGDNWESFPRWYHHEEILKEHRIIIYPRPGYAIDEATLPEGVSLTHAPLLDISSTFVRKALGEGRDIRFFLPNGVYEEIENRLTKE